MEVAKLRGEAPRLVLHLSLDHWHGVAFDAHVRRMAKLEKARQIGELVKKGKKEAGGMDVIAMLVAAVVEGQ